MNDLNQEQLFTLQAKLARARAELLSQLSSERARAPPHEVEASPADNASNRTLNELVYEAAEHTARRLRVVTHALAKFGDGSYGLCENCGEAIGLSRLEAHPEARYCIACQTRLERPRR